MAAPSAAVNPKVKYTPSGSLSLVKVTAGTSKTWKKGEFGYFNSGLAEACATGNVPQFIFAETQSTATSAGAKVWVHMLEVGTELEIAVVTGGSAAAETVPATGTAYDLYVGSNKHYLETSGTTDKCFLVIKKGSEVDERYTTTMTPGIVIVRITKLTQ